MTKITRIAIVGETLATDESEARQAALDWLSWHGNSESDRDPLLAEVSAELDGECEETGRFLVVPRYGSQSGNYVEDAEPLSSHETEEAASAAAAAHNEAALADILTNAEWLDLPQPVSFVWFSGCSRGNYPQRRKATISVTLLDGQGVEAEGWGDAAFLRDSHSHDALASALANLIAALKTSPA